MAGRWLSDPEQSSTASSVLSKRYARARHAEAGAQALTDGRPADASAAFGAGLSLWRGEPLADLADEDAVKPIASRLDELRLFALERRIQADLECGRSAELLAELESLTWEHQLHERLRALHMLALYRSGRQSDAIEVFRVARSTMVEQVGIEPGPELQSLAQAMLRQDAALLEPAESSSGTGGRHRLIALAALREDGLDDLVAIAEPLAALGGHELMLVSTVGRPDDLGEAAADLHRRRDELLGRGVATRAACFVSLAPGSDLAGLVREQEVDLVVVNARGAFDDAGVTALLAEASCDVAVHFGGVPGAGPVLVPFAGVDHDWAAIELGAWLAKARGVPLHLAGARSDLSGKNASRLLASASLAVQRTLGVAASPLLIEPSAWALATAAADAGLVAIGLSGRWPQAGLGPARQALVSPGGPPALLVRRGLRPGGLAPAAAHTRFTWTLLPDQA
jgi:hypothetical protein